MRFGSIVLASLVLLPQLSHAKGEGYLGVGAQFSQLDGQQSLRNTFYGGWLLGGEDEWRAGAAAYRLNSNYDPTGTGPAGFFYTGALIYYVPPVGSNIFALHIGALFGAGVVSDSYSIRKAVTWVVEPHVLLLIKLAAWLGLGVEGGWRYVPTVEKSGLLYSGLSGANLGVSLVLGEL